MADSKNNPVIIASVLAAAALVCLGLAARLLIASGEVLNPLDPVVDTRLATLLTIGGGVVVFLIGTVSLLAARRHALTAGRRPKTTPPDLDLVDIRQWTQELDDIRGDLQREVIDAPAALEWERRELTIPTSFRPKGQYLLNGNKRSSDPLADLKRTRDHLLEAAERVDMIVQSINESTSTSCTSTTSDKPQRHRFFWWRSH